ncbi:MAG: amino acid ABC transporter permease [Acidimicrobiia bacterium]
MILGASGFSDIGHEFFNFRIFKDIFPEILLEGARNTLVFTTIAFVGGLSFGLLLALLRTSNKKILRWPAATFIDLIRGLPLVLIIVIIGFGTPILVRGTEVSGPGLGWINDLWPFGRGGTKYIPGCLALSIVAGAYMAETIRAGIDSISKGQREAARSLGLSQSQAMRKVILPQAFRVIVGPLTNELALLFKDTSLISLLGVEVGGRELTKFARDFVNREANSTPLIAAGICYLIITIPLLQLVAYFERKSKAGQK